MIHLGLTGGIATGKSSVAEMFARMGAHTLDADDVSRIVMSPGHDAYDSVVKRFGSAILSPDGTIDRAKLRGIVFADADARHDLEQIVHPAIHRYERDWREKIVSKQPDAVLITHAALILERGTHTRFDGVIVVTLDEETQIQRAMCRDGAPREAVEKVVRAQMPTAEKQRFATYVVDNSGTLAETEAQVRIIWEQIQKG